MKRTPVCSADTSILKASTNLRHPLSWVKHPALCLATVLILISTLFVFNGSAYAASCGGEGEKGCKITFKRLKTCDKGLHFSLKTKRCVRNKRIADIVEKIKPPVVIKPKPPQVGCGKLGQPGCKPTLSRALKSCDKGLHINLKTGLCVANKGIPKPSEIVDKIIKPKPDHPNCGKLGYPGCRIKFGNIKACDKGLRLNLTNLRCVENEIATAVTSVVDSAVDSIANSDHCGALHQVPCDITPFRPKACDFGFKRNDSHTLCIEGGLTLRPVSDDCGALDQRACKRWESAFACRKGLRRDPPSGYCVIKRDVDKKALRQAAKKVVDDAQSVIKIMSKASECAGGPSFTPPAVALLQGNPLQDAADKVDMLKRAIETKNVSIGIAAGLSHCIGPVLEAAHAGGYKTVTLGVSGGGAAGIGGFIDQGFAFHVPAMLDFMADPENHSFPVPTLYQTKAVSAGLQASVSVGVGIGIYKDPAIEANLRGSDTHGITVDIEFGIGGGVGVWYTYDGALDGLSVEKSTGASIGVGVYNRVNTTIISLEAPHTNVADCGAPNQRACKVWERVPMCDDNTRLDVTAGQCFPLQPAVQVSDTQLISSGNGLGCGDIGERVCRIHEQVPGCNAGLRIDYQAKICAR